MNLRLDEWLAPLSLTEFRRDSLGKRPVSVPQTRPELAAYVMDSLGVHSAEEMLSLRIDSLFAWFQRLDGRHATAEVTAVAARELYASGITVYAQGIPEFAAFESQVAAELGVPKAALKCTLFCNRPNARTPAHFDSVDLLVLQLTGRKVWRMAPNTFAKTPMITWGTGEAVPAQLRIYAHDEPPREMPEGATDTELLPGSALYLPRGYWHETFSDCESLSLHVQLSPLTRVDVFLGALRNELLRDEAWRGSTYDWSLEGNDAEVAAQARQLCERLHAATLRLAPGDVLPRRASPSHVGQGHLVRRGQASFGIESRDLASKTSRVVIHIYEPGATATTTARVEMSDDFVVGCAWISALATGTVIDSAALAAACPALSAEETQRLLTTLTELRLVWLA